MGERPPGGSFREHAVRSARRGLVIWSVVVVAVGCGITFLAVVPSPPEHPTAWVIAGEALVGLLAIWRLVVASRRLADPTRHPVFRDFAPYGEPTALASEVEAELASGDARKLGDIVVTKRFLVALGIVHGVVALDDIGWVYVKQTKYSVNFIPVGTTRSIEIFSYGEAHRWVSMTVDVDAALLDLLPHAAPRARFGYSAENAAWWKQTRLGLSKRATA